MRGGEGCTALGRALRRMPPSPARLRSALVLRRWAPIDECVLRGAVGRASGTTCFMLLISRAISRSDLDQDCSRMPMSVCTHCNGLGGQRCADGMLRWAAATARGLPHTAAVYGCSSAIRRRRCRQGAESHLQATAHRHCSLACSGHQGTHLLVVGVVRVLRRSVCVLTPSVGMRLGHPLGSLHSSHRIESAYSSAAVHALHCTALHCTALHCTALCTRSDSVSRSRMRRSVLPSIAVMSSTPCRPTSSSTRLGSSHTEGRNALGRHDTHARILSGAGAVQRLRRVSVSQRSFRRTHLLALRALSRAASVLRCVSIARDG